MKFKTRKKLGIGIVSTGVLFLGLSLALPAISSYLVVAGIVLVLVGCFVIAPNFAF